MSHGRLLLLYVVSGSAALAAEVVWSRMLHRLLGSASWAVAIVLASFLAGMGVGAFIAEKAMPRSGRRLRAFAGVEIVAAALTLAGTMILQRAPGVFRGQGGEAVATALLVLLTLPLGAGLPLLVAHVTEGVAARGEAARRVRRLYGLNALGAALGAVVAGLAGVPLIGEWRTILIAAALQVAVGTGAALLARREGEPLPAGAGRIPAAGSPDRARTSSGPLRSGPPDGHGARWRWLALYVLLSGLTVFYWEVLWTRILVLAVGSSVYAFSLVAAAVVLGIGVGSLTFGGRWLHRHGGWALPLLTLAALLAAYGLVPRLPDAYLLVVSALRLPPHLGGPLGAALIAFVPNFLLGSLFPWTVSRRLVATGSLYAVNCAGCVVGALLAGPVLAGLLPLELSYRLGCAATAALAATGCWLLACEVRELRSRAAGWLLALGILSVFLTAASFPSVADGPLRGARAWDFERLLSGVYQWSREDLAQDSLRQSLSRRRLLVVVEGREVIVSAESVEERNTLYIKANGKVEGSVPLDPARPSSADLPTQILLGTVPAMLVSESSAAPRLVIGLGSGVSLGALWRTRQITLATGAVDLIEIEPAFLDVLRRPEVRPFVERYFDPALEAKELSYYFGDARRVLHRDLADRRYVAIVSQPSEPWVVGAAPLFTREFFEQASAMLAPDGVFTQWIQLYKLDRRSLRILVRTFRSVFPRVFVLRPPGTGELLLIGSRGRIDLRRLFPASDLPGVRETGISGPIGWLAIYLLGPEGVDRWIDFASGGAINTDARGELEFRAPRGLSLGVDTARAHLAEIRAEGANDPVTRYLPPRMRTGDFARRLARSNILLGDLDEAEAIVAGDVSDEARRIREEIAERRATRGEGSRR